MSEYRPFDQEEWLGVRGECGWQAPRESIEAWEAAHGHDVRLKCYPEFGCQAIEYESDSLRAELSAAQARIAAALKLCDEAETRWSAPGWVRASAVRAALAGEPE